MNIIVKKNYLYIAEFKLKCSIGKKGVKKNKIEGDKTTPKGKYQLGTLYYRKDRLKKINSNLDEKIIKKNYGWCNDSKSKKYNKLVKINNKSKFTFEKLYRKDSRYDALILIKYNYPKAVKNFGSAIFLHLTKNYKPTDGCIALIKKDFIILAKLIDKKTKIIIN
tara:strand:+ start:306 stop:800 length:495 start_codon:yes stop_codon:yes gene_type:complete